MIEPRPPIGVIPEGYVDLENPGLHLQGAGGHIESSEPHPIVTYEDGIVCNNGKVVYNTP